MRHDNNYLPEISEETEMHIQKNIKVLQNLNKKILT